MPISFIGHRRVPQMALITGLFSLLVSSVGAGANDRWLPTKLGPKLILWIDPTDLRAVVSKQGRIAEIADRGGSKNKATQDKDAAQPMLAADPDGSGQMVISNKVGTALQLPSGVLEGRSKASVYSLGWRFEPDKTNRFSQGPLIGNLTDIGHEPFAWPYDGDIYDGFCSTIRKHVGKFPSYQSWHVFYVHSEANLYEFRVDGGDGKGGLEPMFTDTTNVFNSGAAGTPFIGSDSVPGASTLTWTGFIGSLILTDGTETSDERAKIEGYLAWSLGKGAVLPRQHPFRQKPPVQ